MEKRIAGIIRWLERCLKACHAGSMESALMDAECARADMDRLRDVIWQELSTKHEANGREKNSLGRFSAAFLKVAFLGVAVILGTATPLAKMHEGELVVQDFNKQDEALELEWVTPDEKMLLGNLRKHLSDGNVYTAKLEDKKLQPAVYKALYKEDKTADNKNVSRSQEDVTYDNIIALIKTGEKALKDESPVIRIERR